MKTPLIFLAASLSFPVCHALGDDGIFVAVGYGGRRMASRDGQTWEHIQQWADKGADDLNNLMGLAFGKGKFVCVGGGGFSRETQGGHILVSTDGIAVSSLSGASGAGKRPRPACSSPR